MPLETVVRDGVLAALRGSGLAAAITAATDGDDEAARLMDELRTLAARLDELARSNADGLLDLRSWTVARERVSTTSRPSGARSSGYSAPASSSTFRRTSRPLGTPTMSNGVVPCWTRSFAAW